MTGYPPIEHAPREREVRCRRHNAPSWRWDSKCPRCLIEDEAQS